MNKKPILYFFYMTGCGACDEAKPELKKFMEAHPLIKVAPVDIAKVQWKSSVWQPAVTPTYGWLVPGQRLRVKQGMLTKDELSAWVNT